MAVFGPRLYEELVAANVAQWVYAWDTAGEVVWNPAVTSEQQALIQVILSAHDPNRPSAQMIAAEADRRVAAAGLSDRVQKIGMAHVLSILSAGSPSGQDATDMALAGNINGWIKATLGASTLLAASGEIDYTSDTKWPAWSTSWDNWVVRAASGFSS